MISILLLRLAAEEVVLCLVTVAIRDNILLLGDWHVDDHFPNPTYQWPPPPLSVRPGSHAMDYFLLLGFVPPPHENPADFFLDTISGEAGETTGN